MNSLEQIEEEVLELSDNDFKKLYNWIVELNHKKWDEQIEKDSSEGLLDNLANQAIADYEKGLSKRL
jgi:hypothetical protein